MAGGNFQIEKGRPVNCNGHCWTYYKGMMLVLFEKKGVLEVADGTAQLPSDATATAGAQFAKDQASVKQLILGSLSMELGQQVIDKGSGTEMWEYLCKHFEGRLNGATKAITEQMLYNELQSLKCKANWNVAQHVEKMFAIKTQLVALQADVRDPIFIGMVLRSLPSNPRFDRLRGMAEIGDDKIDTPGKMREMILTMDQYNKQDRSLQQSNGGGGQTQGSQGQGQSQRKPNQTAKEGKSAEKAAAAAERKEDMKKQTCFLCHKEGHKKAECPAKKTDETKRQTTYTKRLRLEYPKGESNTDSSDTEVSAVTARVAAMDLNGKECGESEKTSQRTVSSSKKEEETAATNAHPSDRPDPEWCFDSGANTHVASDHRYFTSYRQFGVGEETDSMCGYKKQFRTTPEGIGTVELKVRNNGKLETMILEDTIFDPDGINILSQSGLEATGYDVKYSSQKTVYTLWREGKQRCRVAKDAHGLWTFQAENQFLPTAVSVEETTDYM